MILPTVNLSNKIGIFFILYRESYAYKYANDLHDIE